MKTEKMGKGALHILAFLVLWASLSAASAALEKSRGGEEWVILLHGLGRSSRSLARLEADLAGQGYSVLNLDYPSLKYPIAYLAEEVLHPEVARLSSAAPDKIHFVTHSMGGIVVRYYLKRHDVPSLGRVVMLAPPNQGSELADLLMKSVLFNKFMAPAGRELGTGMESLPRQLGRPDFELGVIAGNRSLNPVNSLLLEGPDDGTVAVQSTRIPGLADFIVLPCSHNSIVRDKKAIGQVIYFLRHGTFQQAAGSG
jgi:alpha-beta hydrolase superfamily lysophospholipase